MFLAPISDTSKNAEGDKTNPPLRELDKKYGASSRSWFSGWEAGAEPTPPGTSSGQHPSQARRVWGNQAVLRMLGRPSSNLGISRSAPLALQTKLAVNQPGDEFEVEADRVPESVMRMTDPSESSVERSQGISIQRRLVQRTCSCGEAGGECEACVAKQEALQRAAAGPGEAPDAPPIVDEVLRSPGQALDRSTRAFFEPRFGHDFSQVRVHTGERAVRSAQAVQARAYTVGRDVVFGSREYSPGTPAGQLLLAHELTHVVQQGHGLQLGPDVGANGSQRNLARSTLRLQRQDDGNQDTGPVAQADSGTQAGSVAQAGSQAGGSAAPAAPAASAGSCTPIGAAAGAACTESNPLVKDDSSGKYVLWNGWLRKCAPQLNDSQQAVVRTVESKRIDALNNAIKTAQAVQAAILGGELRPSPSGVFFRALSYMNIFWSDATGSRYFDYFNNPEDAKRYDRLGKTAAVLSQNLSFLVYPGRYVCSDLAANVGAVGTSDGIVLPPGWFAKDAGYQLLTLTHEYFHVMINPLIDDYPAFKAGQICTFDEALTQPNCLSAFVAWFYTGQDEQQKAGGFQPCLPGQGASAPSPTIQPKLLDNRPGDPYEDEADRVAERVMSMPADTNG